MKRPDRVRRPSRRAVLITDAERSPAEQLRSRQVRYVLMMSVRAMCLVLATVLAVAQVPLLWLWVPLCLVGMVVIPWLAVIIANDRAPQARYRLANRLRRAPAEQPAPVALPPAHADGRVNGRTIDIDV